FCRRRSALMLDYLRQLASPAGSSTYDPRLQGREQLTKSHISLRVWVMEMLYPNPLILLSGMDIAFEIIDQKHLVYRCSDDECKVLGSAVPTHILNVDEPRWDRSFLIQKSRNHPKFLLF